MCCQLGCHFTACRISSDSCIFLDSRKVLTFIAVKYTSVNLLTWKAFAVFTCASITHTVITENRRHRYYGDRALIFTEDHFVVHVQTHRIQYNVKWDRKVFFHMRNDVVVTIILKALKVCVIQTLLQNIVIQWDSNSFAEFTLQKNVKGLELIWPSIY